MILAQSERGREVADELKRQHAFMAELAKFAKEIRYSKENRNKKIERLKAVIRDGRHPLADFSAGSIPLPLDARIQVTGIDPERATVFKSNLSPLRLCFLTDAGDRYEAIFKYGDDMRQDQLVIQLFTLMDRLLRNEHLDLKLTPYRVLATGPIDGMVQFVPSMTLGEISNQYSGSLLNYMRATNPDEGSVGTYGVAPAVLDTFVRSCGAFGYSCPGRCVLTRDLLPASRLLRCDVPPRRRRSSPRQPAPVARRALLPRRFRLHPRAGPETVPSGRQGLQGDGRRDGRGRVGPLRPVPELVLHGVHELEEERELDHQLGRAHGRRQHSRHQARAGQGRPQGALRLCTGVVVGLHSCRNLAQIQEKFRLDLSEEEAIKHFEGLLNETSYITAVFDRCASSRFCSCRLAVGTDGALGRQTPRDRSVLAKVTMPAMPKQCNPHMYCTCADHGSVSAEEHRARSTEGYRDRRRRDRSRAC